MSESIWCTLGIFYCANFAFGVDVSTLDKEAGALQYVHLLHRNGEKSIEKGHILDPYSEEKFWTDGLGKLTSQGILNQYQLGRFLGERYSSLTLNRKYDRRQYRSYSAPNEENFLSATAVSQGLFLSTWSDTLNENMKWIPVHVLEDKNLQPYESKCLAYEASKRDFFTSREYQTLMIKYDELLQGAANYTGLEDKNQNLMELPKLWNHFTVESNYKLELHEWAKIVYPTVMQEPVSLAYIVPTWTTGLKKAVAGRFLNSLLDSLSKKINGSEVDNHITAICTSDFGIAAILDALGVFNSLPIPFDATIMIELRKLEDSNHTVTVLYSNETLIEGKPERKIHILNMPNCTQVCTFDKFRELISPYIIEDWDLFCTDGTQTDPHPSPSRGDCSQFSWMQITIPVAVGTVIILVVYTICKKMRTKGTIVMNNPENSNRNELTSDSNESAAVFVTSLNEVPALFIDPVGGWMTPYDIFTLPPPFTSPPDMMSM